MIWGETAREFGGLWVVRTPADNSVELTTDDGQTYTCCPQDIGLPGYDWDRAYNDDKDDKDGTDNTNNTDDNGGNGGINRVRAWMAARRLLRAAGVDVW